MLKSVSNKDIIDRAVCMASVVDNLNPFAYDNVKFFLQFIMITCFSFQKSPNFLSA